MRRVSIGVDVQIPIDIKTVINEATDLDKARCTPVSVSVYVDESAPQDLKQCVRRALFCKSNQARVSEFSFNGTTSTPFSGDDMAIIVAGLDDRVGLYASLLRSVGVPVMVVTTLPALVAEIAQAQQTPLLKDDIICPKHIDPLKSSARSLYAKSFQPSNMVEPCFLDQESSASLLQRMGEWVIASCEGKKLAFALNFNFVCRPLCLDIVKSTALQNAGVGFFFIIPGADMPVMTLNQAKMILMIAAAHGEELNLERVKELVVLVGGAFACRAFARQIVGIVPGLGWVTKAAIGYMGTYIMGRAAVEYFEGAVDTGKFDDFFETLQTKAMNLVSNHIESNVAQDINTVINNPLVIAEHVSSVVRNGVGK